MGISVTRIEGPDVAINCPACGAKGVVSRAFSNKEVANLVLRHTTHWVTCGVCNQTLYSKLPVQDLVGHTPEQLERHVVRRTSLPARVLSVLSLFLFYWPILGPVVSFASWMANFRQPKVARRSMILFIIGALLTVALFVWISMDDETQRMTR
jgi:hypothetical protein